MAANPPVVPVKDNREKLLERAMSRHQYSGDALIEVLHTAQELFGSLSPPLLRTVPPLRANADTLVHNGVVVPIFEE